MEDLAKYMLLERQIDLILHIMFVLTSLNVVEMILMLFIIIDDAVLQISRFSCS